MTCRNGRAGLFHIDRQGENRSAACRSCRAVLETRAPAQSLPRSPWLPIPILRTGLPFRDDRRQSRRTESGSQIPDQQVDAEYENSSVVPPAVAPWGAGRLGGIVRAQGFAALCHACRHEPERPGAQAPGIKPKVCRKRRRSQGSRPLPRLHYNRSRLAHGTGFARRFRAPARMEIP